MTGPDQNPRSPQRSSHSRRCRASGASHQGHAVRTRAWLSGILATVLLLTLSGAQPRASGSADREFGGLSTTPLVLVPLRLGEDPQLPPGPDGSALGAVEHVVVLVHGWDTPAFASTRDYATIAGYIQRQFTGRVRVVGVQWPSDAGPRRKWIPQLVGHSVLSGMSFRNAVRHPYKSMVPLARSLGRTSLRRLLFEVQDHYPAARLHVFAHSLGAEMTLRAIEPHIDLPPARVPEIYRFSQPLRLDLVVLAGADLDSDFPLRVSADRPHDPPALFWITVPGRGSTRDRVLRLRRIVRGKVALGNRGFQLRKDQLDWILGERHVIYDTEHIPRDHGLLEYFCEARIAHLAEAADDLRHPERPSRGALAQVDGVLTTPPDRELLRRYLESSDLSVNLYALWRLEHLLCGSSEHLADGTLLRAARHSGAAPKATEKERAVSTCRVIREGLWPPGEFPQPARR